MLRNDDQTSMKIRKLLNLILTCLKKYSKRGGGNDFVTFATENSQMSLMKLHLFFCRGLGAWLQWEADPEREHLRSIEWCIAGYQWICICTCIFHATHTTPILTWKHHAGRPKRSCLSQQGPHPAKPYVCPGSGWPVAKFSSRLHQVFRGGDLVSV